MSSFWNFVSHTWGKKAFLKGLKRNLQLINSSVLLPVCKWTIPVHGMQSSQDSRLHTVWHLPYNATQTLRQNPEYFSLENNSKARTLLINEMQKQFGIWQTMPPPAQCYLWISPSTPEDLNSLPEVSAALNEDAFGDGCQDTLWHHCPDGCVHELQAYQSKHW